MKQALHALALLAFAACQPANEARRDFEEGCWPLSDTLALAAPASGYEIDIRFDPEYGYQNIYLQLLAERPGEAPQPILLLDTLLDPSGSWIGPEAYRSRLSGTLESPAQLSLVHYMRDSLLCQVRSVRLRAP
jgi:hypothetical protein